MTLRSVPVYTVSLSEYTAADYATVGRSLNRVIDFVTSAKRCSSRLANDGYSHCFEDPNAKRA
jgi:hypothetical protein